ncbi:MAG: WHG domain-containing protein [Clostridium sp.]|jgi:AcrR family transcriptional regulator|nr:WHG domain-containing protein [Clostridium sp.]
MPPKAKFTKEEVIQTALSLVRQNGIDGLTARSLGAALKTSSRPIFTAFHNMEDVIQAVLSAAKALYAQYIEEGLRETIAFKGVGAAYIRFAMEEPKLFQLLFMAEQATLPSITGVLPLIDDNYEKILQSIVDGYSIDETKAKDLYQHLWVYSHGIASLCATKMCRFTPKQIGDMMTEVFSSLYLKSIGKG